MEEPIERRQAPRVRFKMGQLEFELEGPTAFDEFRRLKEEGLGKLAADGGQPAVLQMNSTNTPFVAPDPPQRISTNGRPSLSDLAVKSVAQSEREWVAVYGYYLTEVDGKKTFSRGNIWEKYQESNRNNESRQANLSENINRAVKAGWLTKVKENTYGMQDDGKAKAREVMARKGSPKNAEGKAKSKEA
jgi:hypothetical protein